MPDWLIDWLIGKMPQTDKINNNMQIKNSLELKVCLLFADEKYFAETD